MIEVVDVKEEKQDKPEITPELVLAAARVIRDFCKQRVHCEGCVARKPICINYLDKPYVWDLPERED